MTDGHSIQLKLGVSTRVLPLSGAVSALSGTGCLGDWVLHVSHPRSVSIVCDP